MRLLRGKGCRQLKKIKFDFSKVGFWIIAISLAAIASFCLMEFFLRWGISEICWTMIGSIGTVTGVLITAYSIVKSNNIAKKQKTYEAFEKMKSQNIKLENKIDRFKAAYIQRLIKAHEKDTFSKEQKKVWTEISEYLSSIERFSACANEGIYDFTMIYNMGGPFLIGMYEKLFPIIKSKRESKARNSVYEEFEKLVIRLKQER